ncbi:hypothetical protein C2845_PM13G23810 [Panicum miliaceum]|uniref:F-box domain-containing protein n=1 Tax=Panicum miliaceum TaxID=4540 RepID=A0A3L6RHU3_PANMI|nr:hypothetical protein C2845_PM13G23810 [Panicum miliaceum]
MAGIHRAEAASTQEPKPFLASWIDTTADMDHDAGVASPPWAELPAEVLGEVARHLHDAAGFLRFHAVCPPWRAASSAPAPAALHPWLVAPCGLFSSGMRFRWPFSPEKGKGGARFDSADAASGRVLAAGVFDDDRTASLVNPLTGDAAPLPPLPCAVARGTAWSRGVFCSNGAVLCDTTFGRLVAAVLQPGEADWDTFSFEDGTVTVVDELPAMFGKKSMWYTPRPRISAVPSSREPALNATDQAS